MELGKLEKVELRDIWKHEALDFTKWLSKEENIAILSKELGIDIEVLDIEMNVGRYNVDIFAKDSQSDRKIIIENQLETTDHDHLGKVLVYSAGLDANIAIWIVKDVNEEHKQAVEWLNENTFDNINVFLVKVELWKIGDSLVAPKFQVICEPNNWAKALKEKSYDDASGVKLENLNYWRGFVDYSKSIDKSFITQKPSIHNWYVVRIGSSDYKIRLLYNSSLNSVKCQFAVYDKEFYKKLEIEKESIDSEIPNLEWDYVEDRKGDKISLTYDNVSEDIEGSYKWLLDNAIRFRDIFLKYLNK